uniref:Uncharacterized protein LOC8268592 n=1 Tax=Rhizophora mucronata TaxID=61149 RepID=A0A2P2J5M8_RHIMU
MFHPFQQQDTTHLIFLMILMMMFLALLHLYYCPDKILLTCHMTLMRKNLILRETVFSKNSQHFSTGNQSFAGMKVLVLDHLFWEVPSKRGKIFDGNLILYLNVMLLREQAIVLSNGN